MTEVDQEKIILVHHISNGCITALLPQIRLT